MCLKGSDLACGVQMRESLLFLVCALWHLVCAVHCTLYVVHCCNFAPPGCKANGQAAMIMTALRVPSSKFSPRPKHSNHSTSESLFVHALSTTFIVLCFQPVCGKKVGVVEKRMSLWADYQIRGKAWHDRSGREFPRQRRRIQLSAGPASSKPLIASHQICQGSRTKHHRAPGWPEFPRRETHLLAGDCKLSDLKWERSLSGLRR